MSALDKLNAFIDTTSPKLATFLEKEWKQQQNAITYKELREAIINGEMSLGAVQLWQQKYSNFIVNYYNPLAEQAIIQATNDLYGKYAGWLRDVQTGAMEGFINSQGGKLIVEITNGQRKAINTLVKQAAMAEGFSVDQLARAIRPTIGLTTRQSQATYNFYQQKIKDGYSHDEALLKQAKYAERMHRVRAATIAQTEMAFAYNAGAEKVIESHIASDYIKDTVTRRWLTAADERVCDICGKTDNEKRKMGEPFSNGVMLPPGHPRCRCAVAYDDLEVIQPAQPPQQPQAAAQAPAPAQQPAAAPQAATQATPAKPKTPKTPKPKPATTTPQTPATSITPPTAASTSPDPGYKPPAIPDAPQPKNLKYKSSVNLGTGEMHQYLDEDGKEWYFKPANSKSGKYEPFRAHIQESGYKVQGIVDPDSAVPATKITLDTPGGTKFGAAQLKQEVSGTLDLKAWQHSPGALDREVISQLQRENVTDWLLGNYDSHGGNFLWDDATKKLIGVDKEQSFRYIKTFGTDKMSYTFHPNAAYGETEPIYNTLYRRFAQGKTDFDLNDILPAIKRVEAIPDAAYREIFRDYAEAIHGKGATAEGLLDSIVKRKQNLRDTVRDFYSEILTERKGSKISFQFADEITQAAAAPPLQAASMSAKTLQAMSSVDLKALAKKQGIQYNVYMTKQQLVDAISDPSKTAQIVADAKAKAYAAQSAPKKPPKAVATPTPTPKPAKPPVAPVTAPVAPVAPAAAAQATGSAVRRVDGIMQLTEAMDDFDKALQGTNIRGVSLISDKGSLEGMQTNLRKIIIDGEEYYELSGRLTNNRWMKVNADIGAGRLPTIEWEFHQSLGRINYSRPAIEMTRANTRRYRLGTSRLTYGNSELLITENGTSSTGRAMMGEFQLRIKAANGVDAAREAQQLLQQAKMMDIVEEVEDAALTRYKKMRLIWQHDPKAAARLTPSAAYDADIDKQLARLGFTTKDVDNLRMVKVSDDYFTLVNDAAIKILDKEGVAYVWSGIPSRAAAESIIESGEMISSTQRMKRGILTGGASVGSDFGTGGADSVFTRVAMNKDIGVQSARSSFSSGNYQFVFDKKALTRTDWYGYTSDSFGTTASGSFDSRESFTNFFKSLKRRYRSSNEVMFRKSLSFDDLLEIRTQSASSKADLIQSLNAKGITHIGTRRLEDIIKITGGEL